MHKMQGRGQASQQQGLDVSGPVEEGDRRPDDVHSEANRSGSLIDSTSSSVLLVINK